jgi:hypothetical protein
MEKPDKMNCEASTASIGTNWNKTIMFKSTLVFLAALAYSLPVFPQAQETNVSTVIIKATTEIGSLTVETGVVTVKCREMTDATSGRVERGIAMEITQKGEPKDRLLIDYDEIPGLLNAIDYLNKVNFSVTRLNIFDATFTTRGGVRIAAQARQRTGAIQFAIMDIRTNLPPVTLSRDEMSRFGGLVDEAKRKLDSVRGG